MYNCLSFCLVLLEYVFSPKKLVRFPPMALLKQTIIGRLPLTRRETRAVCARRIFPFAVKLICQTAKIISLSRCAQTWEMFMISKHYHGIN